MSFHKESTMFDYWQARGQVAGIMNIVNNGLAHVIVDHIDILARNQFFSHPFPMMGTGTATGFDGIASTEIATTELLDNVWLSLNDREKPYGALPVHYPVGNEVVCITTSGVVHDLKREDATGSPAITFIEASKYQNAVPLFRGELGMWRGVRFVNNGMARLWNMGTITHQATIDAELTPGSGAPDPATTAVEGSRYVGQPGATHTVTVDDSSGFAVGDMVTIHKTRHADYAATLAVNGAGVVDGPVYTDAMLQNVEIHSIPDGTHIVLKEPYMMTDQAGEGLETDLGSGVYGYVTLGDTVHSMLFLAPGMANLGLVCGVAQPPNIYTPKPIDDFESIYRISYDMWMKFALWDARAFDLVWIRGANALRGKSAPFY